MEKSVRAKVLVLLLDIPPLVTEVISSQSERENERERKGVCLLERNPNLDYGVITY